MRCARPTLTRAGERWACLRCDYCQWRGSRELFGRSDREFHSMRADQRAVMGTLTFRDEDLCAAMRDWGRAVWQAFEVRVCQLVPGLKLFAVPEFGSLRDRLHVHFVAYGVPEALCRVFYVRENGHSIGTFEFRQVVRAAWPHGTERCDVVRDRGGGRYVMKYVAKGRADSLRERDAWKRRAAELEARGLQAPEFRKMFWTSWPRGRQGGLGRQFAGQLAAACESHPLVVAGVDVPPHLVGAGGRRASITRYERRVARRLLGLDSERAKALRKARNPEPVEMAWRVGQAGGVERLRCMRGHVDEDVSAQAAAKARSAKSLGRW